MNEHINQTIQNLPADNRPPQVTFQNPADIPEFLVMHKDYATFDCRNWQKTPRRIVSDRRFTGPKSFADYVLAMGDKHSLIGYCNGDPPRFVAVLDYHGIMDQGEGPAVQPRWCSHRANFTPQYSRAFRTWKEKNTASFTTAGFGEFIEENAPDIIDPPAARMMDIANNLTVAKNVDLRSHERLEDGSLMYHFAENVTGNVALAKGPIDIPRVFRIRAPIFDGTPPVEFDVLFRYRADQENGVRMLYKIQRMEAAVEEAVNKMAAEMERILVSALGGIGLLQISGKDALIEG